MKAQIIVKAHPDTGEVITINESKKDGKNYGKIRLEAHQLVDKNGLLQVEKRVAFVTITPEALPMMTPMLKADGVYPLEGKLVVKETFEPQWSTHRPKMNPVTQEYVRVDGKEVYRNTIFTQNFSEPDEFITQSANSNVESDAE